jgi:hypothetical protein
MSYPVPVGSYNPVIASYACGFVSSFSNSYNLIILSIGAGAKPWIENHRAG